MGERDFIEDIKDLVVDNPAIMKFIHKALSDAIAGSGIPDVEFNAEDPLGDVFKGAEAIKDSQEFGEQAEEAARKFGGIAVDLVIDAVGKALG